MTSWQTTTNVVADRVRVVSVMLNYTIFLASFINFFIYASRMQLIQGRVGY